MQAYKNRTCGSRSFQFRIDAGRLLFVPDIFLSGKQKLFYRHDIRSHDYFVERRFAVRHFRFGIYQCGVFVPANHPVQVQV
jgi:hypothetical protein